MKYNFLYKFNNKRRYRALNLKVPPKSKIYFLWVILVLLGIIFINAQYTTDFYLESNKQRPQVKNME